MSVDISVSDQVTLSHGEFIVTGAGNPWGISGFLQFECWPHLIRLVAPERGWNADLIIADLSIAQQIAKLQIVQDCWYGAQGDLADWGKVHGSIITLAQFRQLIAEGDRREATKEVRAAAMQERRREFNASRAQIILRLLEVGKPYICATPECSATKDLTIDHIEPLSRGGSDEIDNLQFMCRSCNSKKGDKLQRRAA